MPTLRAFQRADVEQIKAHGLKALVASAPGTGKTCTSIRALVEYPHSLPALVVVTPSILTSWAREIRAWAPGVPVVSVDGAAKLVYRPNAIYLVSWNLLQERIRTLLRLRVRTVIADECHFAKNPQAGRAQAFALLAKQAPHLLLLSGTPVVNKRAELEVLKGYLGESAPLIIRRLLEVEAADIPPKTRSYLPVQLRPRHRALYDKAEDEFEEWLIEKQEEMELAGASPLEIEQALSTEALTRIGHLRRLVGEFKVPAAADWISRAARLGEPVVVFVEHQRTLHRLQRALRKQRIRHVTLEGNSTAKQRQAAVDAFQAHQVPVFIGTRAAEVGITLHAARHLVFVERFWTAADEEQAEDRIRRIGQTHATTMWYLHAVDTIDARMDEIVREKRRIVLATIGNAEIDEAPEVTVRSLVTRWTAHAHKGTPTTPLGLGTPLPPLPRPSLTHAVVFTGDRWTASGAQAWCRMHGYQTSKLHALPGRLKVVGHPAAVFTAGSFGAIPVCDDIRVIIGKRLSPENERRVRAMLG